MSTKQDEPGVLANWSTNIPDALTFNRNATPMAIRVYLALKSFHQGSFPSLKWLGEKLGVKEDATRSAIRCLESIGYLVVEPRYRPDGGRTSNLYRVRDTPARSAQTDDPPGSEPTTPLAQNPPQEHLQDEQVQEDRKPARRSSRHSKQAAVDDPIPTIARSIVDAVIADRRAAGLPKPRALFPQVRDVREMLRLGNSEADVLWAALNAPTMSAGAMEIVLSNRRKVAPTDPTKAAMDDGSHGFPENLRPEPGKSRIFTADERRQLQGLDVGSSDGEP